MCKRIFVAIDASATAQLALDEAIALAKMPGGSLCIASALDTSSLAQAFLGVEAFVDTDKVKQGMRDKTDALLDLAAAKATAAGCDPYRQLIESDEKSVADMLADAAHQWDADLIVIGTHGRRGLNRMVMGSVAENLVRIATTSLMLVRRKAD